MEKIWIMAVGMVALAGCAALQPATPSAPEAAAPDTQTQRPQDRPDVPPTSVAAPAAAGTLGRTVASLGNPGEGGVWLVTGLVTQPTPGRVRDVATGQSIALELRPSGAAQGGARLSLEGFRGLGLGPTALPVLEVSRE